MFSERAPYCVGVVGRVTGWSRSADATSDVRAYLTASFWFQLDICDVRTRRRPRVDESGPGVTLRMHYLFLGGRTPRRSVARLRASAAVLSGASSTSRAHSLESPRTRVSTTDVLRRRIHRELPRARRRPRRCFRPPPHPRHGTPSLIPPVTWSRLAHRCTSMHSCVHNTHPR